MPFALAHSLEHDAANWLLAWLPPSDLADLDLATLREHVDFASDAYRRAPWRDQLPREIWLRYVVPHRVSQEPVQAWRAQFALPVIAVTGSNGKTTTKEMIAAIFTAQFGDAFLATRGNLNNDIGLPLTLLGLGAAHRAAVIELGMNRPGEIGSHSQCLRFIRPTGSRSTLRRGFRRQRSSSSPPTSPGST